MYDESQAAQFLMDHPHFSVWFHDERAASLGLITVIGFYSPDATLYEHEFRKVFPKKWTL